MIERIKILCKSTSSALVVLSCVLLIGCGGAKKDPPPSEGSHSSTSAAPVGRGNRPQPAGDVASSKNDAITSQDKAACEQAVQSAPLLAAAAKTEIAALCFRINYVPEDNERTVRAVCQEVANASSLSSETARKRTVSACYAVGIK